MVNIVPYFRAERSSVILRVFINDNLVKGVATGIKIQKGQWNEDKRRVTGHANEKLYNQKIQLKINELNATLTRAELLGTVLTKDRVRRICEGHVPTASFYDYCAPWIKEKYTNPASYKAMRADLEKVNSFAKNLQFGDIDAKWLTKYLRYLKEDLKQKGNTLWKALKFMRTMLYDATSAGAIGVRNPFETGEFKMPKYNQPEKDGLHTHELDAVEKILTQPHPVVIKIMTAKFLLMCYTGWRISDAKRFRFEDHLKDNQRLVMISKKTNTPTNLRLYHRLENVLNHLRELPAKSVSDDKFNQYLETVQALSEVKRLKFTSHLGRHTFGCLLAEAGVSIEEAMELMGVKQMNVVKVYYKLRQPQIDRAAEKLNLL